MLTQRLLHDREFLLCAACCRWPQDGAAMELVRSLAFGIKWARFEAVVRRHRIPGLAHRALRLAGVEPDPGVGKRLANAAAAAAFHNIETATECLALHAAFDDAEIRVLFVKGLTLAMLAYQQLGIKKGWDIDLLVESDDLEAAAELLEARGYVMTTPDRGRDRLAAWHRYSKETTWKHRQRGYVCENLLPPRHVTDVCIEQGHVLLKTHMAKA